MTELKLNIHQTSDESFNDLLAYSGYPRKFINDQNIEVLSITPEDNDGTTRVRLKIKGELKEKLVDTGNINYQDHGDHVTVEHLYKRIDYISVINSRRDIPDNNKSVVSYIDDDGFYLIKYGTVQVKSEYWAGAPLADMDEFSGVFTRSFELNDKGIMLQGDLGELTYGEQELDYTIDENDRSLFKKEKIKINYLTNPQKLDMPSIAAIHFLKPNSSKLSSNEIDLENTMVGMNTFTRDDWRGQRAVNKIATVKYINEMLNDEVGQDSKMLQFMVQVTSSINYSDKRKPILKELSDAWAAAVGEVNTNGHGNIRQEDLYVVRTLSDQNFSGLVYKNQVPIKSTAIEGYQFKFFDMFSVGAMPGIGGPGTEESTRKVKEYLSGINSKIAWYAFDENTIRPSHNRVDMSISTYGVVGLILARPLTDLLDELKEVLATDTEITSSTIENIDGKPTLTLSGDAFNDKDKAIAKGREVLAKLKVNNLEKVVDFQQIEETDGDGTVEILISAKTTGLAKHLVTGNVRVHLSYTPEEVRPQGNLTGFSRPSE